MTIYQSTEAIQAAIQQDDPEATDHAVSVLLGSLEKLSLISISTPRIGDYGMEFTTTGFSITAQLEAEMRTALNALETACRPLANQAIVKELTTLRTLTKSKDSGDDNAEFQIRVYAKKLAEYPADAVKFALRQWADYSPWWPSWHELKTGLDELCETRLMRRDALRKAAQAADDSAEKKRQIEEAARG